MFMLDHASRSHIWHNELRFPKHVTCLSPNIMCTLTYQNSFMINP